MSNVESVAVRDDAVVRQRAYYEATAGAYDAAHAEREHIVALQLLAGYIQLAGVKSVLDVGAGTGRAMRFLKAQFPNLVIKGVEPVITRPRARHSA
jgi:trans-aconitate methyltransferase